ncbi:SAM-dependent methyltransferase [Microbacterium koreense]|uniref:SAM-dependent methyltransferase n=1 Tax=Microbacterium koreense TaxID=323761 RepID=A0ABW2ZQH9_9MICO
MSGTIIDDDQASSGTAEHVADKVLAAALGWVDLMAIHLGSQLGWYAALTAVGPMDSEELATATGTSERYAREWLEQQCLSGILRQVPSRGGRAAFALVPGAAEVLTDASSMSYLEPLARMLAASAHRIPQLVEAYRSGTGVSWEDFGRHARESQADMNRPWFTAMPQKLQEVERIHTRLSAPGARVADIGTGAGWSAIALAREYPSLRVEGFDVDRCSLEDAEANAADAGVGDRVSFHLVDAADLADHGPFDAVFAFECLHDMPHPIEVLAAARAAVTPEGVVVVMDEAAADEFDTGAGDLERLLYGFSLFVCLPDGMSHPNSVGTGTVMRHDTLRAYAREAGWKDAEVVVPEFGLWRFYLLS